jgi:hypothetical protein
MNQQYEKRNSTSAAPRGMVQANVGQKRLKRNIFKTFFSPVNR